MLFSRRFHDAIERGAITRSIRRWRRPQARPGGQYRLTNGSSIEVDTVRPIEDRDLSADDALRSGFDSLEELRAAIPDRADATLYRIDFRWVGRIADPRAALASDATLDVGELEELTDRLAKMDARSGRPWTRETLEQIDRHPGTVSHQLAKAIGFETPPFKANVRKLKTLGLTISLETGYRLSPRGQTVLIASRTTRRPNDLSRAGDAGPEADGPYHGTAPP